MLQGRCGRDQVYQETTLTREKNGTHFQKSESSVQSDIDCMEADPWVPYAVPTLPRAQPELNEG